MHAAVAQRLQEALGITRGQYYSYIQPRVAARSDEDGPWDVDPVLVGCRDRVAAGLLKSVVTLVAAE